MAMTLRPGPGFCIDNPGTPRDGSSMIGMLRRRTSASDMAFTQKGASRTIEPRLAAVADSTGLATTLRPAPARAQRSLRGLFSSESSPASFPSGGVDDQDPYRPCNIAGAGWKTRRVQVPIRRYRQATRVCTRAGRVSARHTACRARSGVPATPLGRILRCFHTPLKLGGSPEPGPPNLADGD